MIKTATTIRREQPKSLSGIETTAPIGETGRNKCREQPKSLSGIETKLVAASWL